MIVITSANQTTDGSTWVNFAGTNQGFFTTPIGQSLVNIWDERWRREYEKRHVRVRAEPVPYYRPDPRPLPIRRTGGRGDFVPRVKPPHRHYPRRNS